MVFARTLVSGHSWKGKKRQICIEKSLRNCPFFDIDRLFGFDRLLTSDSFCGRTIPRRFSKEENRLFSFGTMTTKDRIGDFRLAGLAGWKWFAEREKTYSTCFDWLLAFAGWKCIQTVRKEKTKEQKKRISSTTRKKRKPVSGLSGERFTGKFFRLLICSFWQSFRERDKKFTKYALKHSFWECES